MQSPDTQSDGLKTLYKRTSTGAIQTWRQEIDGPHYRTISGQLHGTETASGWTAATPKNVGRSNGTTAEQQAELEVAANYKSKLEKDYHESIDNVDVVQFFKPMLAHKFEGELTGGRSFSQPKLDGIRAIVSIAGIFSRNGKPIVAVPHIMEALMPIFERRPDAVFDGELYNHNLADDFNSLVSAIKKQSPTVDELAESREIVQYHVYDFPSMANSRFGERWISLTHLVPEGIQNINRVPTSVVYTQDELDRLYETYLKDGYEGQMVRADKLYEQKRSSSLLKRKKFIDGEFEVVDIEDGLGNWTGYAKGVVAKLSNGRVFGAGISGNQAYCRQLLADKAQYIGKQVTIRYFKPTPDGIPRFGVAQAFHAEPRL